MESSSDKSFAAKLTLALAVILCKGINFHAESLEAARCLKRRDTDAVSSDGHVQEMKHFAWVCVQKALEPDKHRVIASWQNARNA